MEITTIGLDLAKSVFQVHGINADGCPVVKKTLKRRQVLPFFAGLPPCLVGIEACGTSHHWARQISELGHEVRLMPPSYVKAYVKRGKTDAADAEAICEAVRRPSMRFVAIKSTEQQAELSIHRAREILVRQRTQLTNAIRSLLAEFGTDHARGIHQAMGLIDRIMEGTVVEVPAVAMDVLQLLARQVKDLQARIVALEKLMLTLHRKNELAKRLATIPGIGVITAGALAATVSDPGQFRSGRQFAAWLGLTPLSRSSGGKERLGHISKMGDKYIRRLLVVGMTALIQRARIKPEGASPWLLALMERKPTRLITVALANKAARVVWALMVRGDSYRKPVELVAA